jgi:hypothetical protein
MLEFYQLLLVCVCVYVRVRVRVLVCVFAFVCSFVPSFADATCWTLPLNR